MEGLDRFNDISEVVEADRAHVWHHLSQHKQYDTGVDPRVIVEGKGMKVWDDNPRGGCEWSLDGECHYGRR